MQFTLKSGAAEKLRSHCLILGVFESRHLSPAAAQVDQASGGHLSRILRRGDLDGKAGQTLLLHDVPNITAQRVLLVGCGPAKEFGDNAYRTATAAAVKLLDATGSKEAISCLATLAVQERDTAWKVRQAVIHSEEALYLSDQMKSKKEPARNPLAKLGLLVEGGKRETAHAETGLAEGVAIAAGMNLAKELGNLPGNVCTPGYLADQARELARSYRSIKTTVLDRKAMEKLGMGALLSVAKGSRQPPYLIVMEYKGGPRNAKPVALVGKGLTFDAGGISIKPAAAMDEMKYDMCGGASVFGTLKAAAELKLPINVVGVVPTSENLPDGAANKPGDIVTSMSGQTIEILNTDAEGRLILCDALTYVERFEPTAVVDIATLTGACVIALGGQASGLLGNNETLVQRLLDSGKAAGDRAWQLPLWDEYQEQLKSNFADMANIGGREAGTITAACFLSRYTKEYHWAHLDIAGTAWKGGGEKGSTGRPVPLLTRFLIDHGGKRR